MSEKKFSEPEMILNLKTKTLEITKRRIEEINKKLNEKKKV